MSKSCCSSSPQRMILACSGGSNVGQAANQAAVELTREGFGKMYCLVGIGAGPRACASGCSGRTSSRCRFWNRAGTERPRQTRGYIREGR